MASPVNETTTSCGTSIGNSSSNDDKSSSTPSSSSICQLGWDGICFNIRLCDNHAPRSRDDVTASSNNKTTKLPLIHLVRSIISSFISPSYHLLIHIHLSTLHLPTTAAISHWMIRVLDRHINTIGWHHGYGLQLKLISHVLELVMHSLIYLVSYYYYYYYYYHSFIVFVRVALPGHSIECDTTEWAIANKMNNYSMTAQLRVDGTSLVRPELVTSFPFQLFFEHSRVAIYLT
jgi:hypothetical protein